MRFLVTGGAGFIGSNFCHILKQKLGPTDQVIVVDKLGVGSNLRNLEGFLDSNQTTFVKGDICDSTLINALMKDIDVVVNFAAESHVDRSISDPKAFLINNIQGTQVLLEAARSLRSVIFVQISTDEVYGPIIDGAATEEFSLKPSSPYSASKAASDLIALSYFQTYGLDVRVTRCSNNYGRFQNPEKLIPLLLTNLLKNLELPIYGDGENIREWIHVEDHCKAIIQVIERGSSGEVYNIGTSDRYTNLEIAKILLENNQNSKSKIKYVSDRLGHDFRYALNSEKIIESVGFKPIKEFKTSIAEVSRWYAVNTNWWDRAT